ncbi:hypothetical protein BD779DRAFT_625184 [Infundibulicybe gibba]|nr:hypothetical protein BD779DRAFT_625184 [Infundibulicybe gibba]
MVLAQSFVVWRICLTSFHIIAVLSTVSRLYRRAFTHRWWWDDTFACPALMADCVYLGTLWALPGPSHAPTTQTWALLFKTIPFTFLLCFVRVSLALSIARIFPSRQATRRITICLAVAIALAYGTVATLLGVFYRLPHADISTQRITLATICIDVISDSFLVAIPLITLWNIKLPRNQRRLVLAGFSSGICTTATSVTGAVALLRYNTPFLGVITPHLGAIVSLLSCNFLVIITMIYRVFRRVEDLEDPSCESEYTPKSRQPSLGVIPTTIVLTDLSSLYGPTIYPTASAVDSVQGSLGTPVYTYPANNSTIGADTAPPQATQRTQGSNKTCP